MKKLLIMSIALVAIMATVFTVSAFAANTVTIGDITIGKYYDTVEVEGVATQVYNDAYAVVTVPYTVTGDVDRLTFYLAAQDLSAALEGEEAKVIYIDEQVNPNAESFTFVIEKARVKSALSAADEVEAEITYPELYTPYTGETTSPFVMTFKLGGTEVDTADSAQVVFTNPTLFGDVDSTQVIDGDDAVCILKYTVGTYEMNSEKLLIGDLDGTDVVDGDDAVCILKYTVGTMSYVDFLNAIYAN